MIIDQSRISHSNKSKKEQIVKCETIFDHNPTEVELKRLIGRISKEKYLTLNNDTHYHNIYRLYIMRGDKETAEKYYLMISEEARKRAEETAKNRVYFGYKEGEIRQFTDEEEARIEEAMKLALR
jgi:hypothetical protein